MTRLPTSRSVFLLGACLASLGCLLASCEKPSTGTGGPQPAPGSGTASAPATPSPPSPAGAAATPAAPASSPEVAVRELTISAAASTRDVLEPLAAEFSREHTVKVKVNAGPSSGLAAQILQGAPADLFLSANRDWANRVDKEGHAQARADFLTNALVLVVPRGNRAEVHTPKDLLSEKVQRVALAGETVPAGQYADQALKKLELFDSLTELKKIVRGQDVRTTLSHVDRGEADAGIVYSTDLTAAPNVEEVFRFDPASHDEIVYVLVLLKGGAAKPDAKAFFEFLQSPAAAPAFEKAGFQRLNREPKPN